MSDPVDRFARVRVLSAVEISKIIVSRLPAVSFSLSVFINQTHVGISCTLAANLALSVEATC